MVCARQGMGRVGVVAIDGARIAANASPQRSYLPKTLRRLAAEIVAEAARWTRPKTLSSVPTYGDELPAGLAPGAERQARIREALRQAEAEEQSRRESDVEAAEVRLERARAAQQRARARAADRVPPGGDRVLTPADELAAVRRVDARAARAADAARKAGAGQGRRASLPGPRRNVTHPTHG